MARIIKNGLIKVPTQPKDFDLTATGLVFRSYDNQPALEFNIEKQDGTPADLLGATLRLLMYVHDEVDGTVTKEPVPFITKNLITESFLNGHVKYILPEALKAYSGVVETYVYIEYPDGSTSDNLGFTFRMKRSAIDGLAQDKADYFIADFQQLLDGVKQEATDAVNEVLAKVDSSTAKMQELEQRIDEQTEIFNNADVYNKAEIEDKLEPFALRTDIDTLEIKKADKTFVDAQLAKKVDEIVLDESNINFYAKGKLIDSISVAGAGNSTAVQDYIDTLVSNGQIEGVRIARNSVKPEDTTFIKVSTNLFNKSDVEVGSIRSDGTEYDLPNMVRSRYIEVESPQTYSFKNIGIVARYDINLNHINNFYPNEEEGVFTTTPETKFIRVVVEGSVEGTQLNEGSSLQPYEDYYKTLNEELISSLDLSKNIRNGSLGIEKLGFLKVSSNLYNYSTVTEGAYVNETGEVLPSSQNSISDFIAIEPSTVYTLNSAHTTVFYTKDKEFISRATNTGTFTTHALAYFVRLTFNTALRHNVQLNKGNELLPYEDYGTWIPEDYIEPKTDKTYYFAPEDIVGVYKAPEKPYERPQTSEGVYNAFNQLALTYPDYITSAFKGNDESGQYSIYQYHLKPQNVKSDELRQSLPKIVIVCGLHGEEVSSIYSLYHLVEQICLNWKSDSLLEYLRWNVEIVMIPIANPYGFNHRTLENRWGRQNVNGVDINRNFSEGWRLGTIGEPTYGGTEPFSEVEARYVKEMIDANKDAIYFCDYHTNGTSGDDYKTLMWHTINNDFELYNKDVDIASTYFIGKMTREFIKDYDLPEDQGNYGWISYSGSRGIARDYGNLVIGAGSTFECFKKFPTETETGSDLNIKACTEYVANWFLSILRQFKSSY